MPQTSSPDWYDLKKTLEWKYLGYKCEAILGGLEGFYGVPYSYWCGYVTLPVCLSERECSKVHVHGGITWFREVDDGYQYGFDCNHLQDSIARESGYGHHSEEWVKREVEEMADEILLLGGAK